MRSARGHDGPVQQIFSMPDTEQDLVRVVVFYLCHPLFNPHNGTMALERLLNLVKENHPVLYDNMLLNSGPHKRGRSAFYRFLMRHPAVFRTRNMLRSAARSWQRSTKTTRTGPAVSIGYAVRCGRATDCDTVPNDHWYHNDVWYWRRRHVTEMMIMQALYCWFHVRTEDAITVDDFISVYPTLRVVPQNDNGSPRVPLPPRGDLVRLLRKRPTRVAFDNDTFCIYPLHDI